MGGLHRKRKKWIQCWIEGPDECVQMGAVSGIRREMWLWSPTAIQRGLCTSALSRSSHSQKQIFSSSRPGAVWRWSHTRHTRKIVIERCRHRSTSRIRFPRHCLHTDDASERWWLSLEPHSPEAYSPQRLHAGTATQHAQDEVGLPISLTGAAVLSATEAWDL